MKLAVKNVTSFPAPVGYEVLWIDVDAGKVLEREPIVGFLVEDYHDENEDRYEANVCPVTAVRVVDGSSFPHAIVRPVGRVIYQGKVHASIEAFEQHLAATRHSREKSSVKN
jgi:hypothetical protein